MSFAGATETSAEIARLTRGIAQVQRTIHYLQLLPPEDPNRAAIPQLETQVRQLQEQRSRLIGLAQQQETPSSFSLGIAEFGEGLARTVRNLSVGATLVLAVVLLGPTVTAAFRRSK